MATFPSKVNYATGDVLTATNMNDIGGAINLLDGAQYAAGKNKIINGDFGVWQRGTTFTNPVTGDYTSDRWRVSNAAANPTSRTVTQQTFTPGTAPVAGYEGTFFLRSTLTTVGSTTGARLEQRIENVRTFAGVSTTISFWAKSDTARTNDIIIQQNFGSGGSTSTEPLNTTFATTTAWTRFTFNLTVPSVSGKTIGTSSFLSFRLGQANTDGSVLDIWGVQIEEADTASPFQTATGTIQGELAACQRYYFRTTASTGSQTATGIMGITNSTTNLVGVIRPPVTMRIIPSSVDFSAVGVQSTGSALTAISAITISADSTNDTSQLNCTSSGFTANLYGLVRGTTGAGYVGLSAEL